jgi:ribosomal protein S18 acetylase RimI-like enzyme
VCGYARCREDDGFGVYIYDLLVRKTHRGKPIGKALMERVLNDFPNQPIYVMSDVDPYYEKLGYRKVGSIFEIRANMD